MSRRRRVVVGGRHQVVNRCDHRDAIFRKDTDRRGVLGRLGELPEGFETESQAFVLMENHDHLLVRAPEANLSEAIRWLRVR